MIDERPLEAAPAAAEDVVGDGAEEERRERHGERAQEGADRLGPPPETGGP